MKKLAKAPILKISATNAIPSECSMKQSFQMLNDPRFHLVYGVSQQFTVGTNPSKVRLNREGMTLAGGVKKKTVVYPGMLLAEHPSSEKGDLFSPIHGEVTDVNDRSIFVNAKEPEPVAEGEEATLAPEVTPINLMHDDALQGEELIVQVKKLGVNTRSLGKKCKTLIVNGLNPEPGVTWAESMLTSHSTTFKAGMDLLRRFGRAEKIILAVPTGMQVAYDAVDVVHVNADYPNSLNELVIKNVTGKENPPDVACVSLHNVWSLGRVAKTGLPLTETVISIGSYTNWTNIIAKDGSLIGELLVAANIEVKDGDTVLRGGPLRGESLDSLERSITKGTHGVFVVDENSVPPMEGHSPCINCGACVLVCPARITPSVLSCYAEFALYNRCKDESIFSCFDCGLCGYVCMARRPVLQYIRLAKDKLLEAERLASLEQIDLEPSA